MEKSNFFKELNLYEDGDFFVEIRVAKRGYEAWINHKDYGISMLMFGIMKNNGTNHTTYSQFVDMVDGNLDDYKERYMKTYGEE